MSCKITEAGSVIVVCGKYATCQPKFVKCALIRPLAVGRCCGEDKLTPFWGLQEELLEQYGDHDFQRLHGFRCAIESRFLAIEGMYEALSETRGTPAQRYEGIFESLDRLLDSFENCKILVTDEKTWSKVDGGSTLRLAEKGYADFKTIVGENPSILVREYFRKLDEKFKQVTPGFFQR